jgi:integrase
MAGTIRKRTWTTRKGEEKTAWVADYFDQHRKRHKRQFATRRAADVWLLKVRGEVSDGVHTPDGDSITVAEAAELRLTRRQAQRLERGSRRTYEGYVAHIAPRLGTVKLSRLTRPMVEAFADSLAQELSWQRATRILTALKMILNAAQDRGLAGQNVALRVKLDQDERDKRPLSVGIDVPSKAEVQAIVGAVTGRARPRLLTLIFAGLRASELRGLVWADIDRERRILSVRQRADWWGAIGRPKSRNGYRDIPLPPLALNALREWRLASSRADQGGLDLVFPGHGGKVLNHTSLQRCFDEVQQAAGIVDAMGKTKYGLHALRHFFASWRIERGTEPKRLQQLMGHGSIKMTYDTYGHWIGEVADEHARLADDEAAVLGMSHRP